MFGVTVRDHVMVAHSFRGELFGPAQRLHGATYVVDATVRGEELQDGVLVDIDRLARLLHAVLEPLAHRNLDDDPQFRQHLFDLTGGWTVPQILIDGKPIGGYVELWRLDKEGRLAA